MWKQQSDGGKSEGGAGGCKRKEVTREGRGGVKGQTMICDNLRKTLKSEDC